MLYVLEGGDVEVAEAHDLGLVTHHRFDTLVPSRPLPHPSFSATERAGLMAEAKKQVNPE